MKKLLVSVLILSTAVTIFTGCKKSESDKAASAEKITVANGGNSSKGF